VGQIVNLRPIGNRPGRRSKRSWSGSKRAVPAMNKGTGMKAGWVTRKLGDICVIERGGSPRPIDSFLTDAPDGINWIKIGDTKNVTKYITKTEEKIRPEGARRSRMVFEGDFILSNSMSFGRPYIMKTSGCIHDGWLVLRAREPKINQDYLYHVLGSDLVFRQFDRLAAGSTVRNLNIGLVQGGEIPIPSLPEQQRIVGILDEAFDGIATAKANAEKNLQDARALFESHLQSVFTQRGERWVERTLNDVCKQITDGKHGDCTGEDCSGYYFLSAKDVRGGTLNYEGARQITRADFEETHRRTDLEPGDILVTNSGTIGRLAIAPSDDRTSRTTFQKSVAILKPVRTAIDSRFAFHCLSSGLARFVNLSAGTAQKNLLLRDLRAYRLALPQSVDQQQLLGIKLDALSAETQRLESIYRQKLAALDALKKALLDQAFTGAL
jgi:type I restriction enzyme S subunit